MKCVKFNTNFSTPQFRFILLFKVNIYMSELSELEYTFIISSYIKFRKYVCVI